METAVKQTSAYKDIYDETTEMVIKLLEEGKVMWQCSWKDQELPKNFSTNTYYRGWNVFLLNFHSMIKSYPTTEYLTFKQAVALGGKIRKGEKGIKIIYWATIKAKADKESIIEVPEEDKKTKMVPKHYVVFNIAQTEDIPQKEKQPIQLTSLEKIDNCERVINEMPNRPGLNLDGSRAFYQPTLDLVVVPSLSRSIGAEEYYSTLFHELAHSTGHLSRLNRKELMESDGFGKTAYAKEELTAEMTATYLCAVTGIGQPTIANSAAYIESWLKALKNDKRLIITAAAQAQKAADYIQNVKQI